jgi:hypothetical protein
LDGHSTKTEEEETYMTIKTKISLAAMACACLALTNARAVPITLKVDPNVAGTTAYVLGSVNPPKSTSAANEVIYLDALIELSLGGSTTVGSDTIYRSDNSFGSLSQATKVGDLSGDSTSIALGSSYQYLVAKYGGAKGGLEIWDIASIASGTTIDIPADAYGAGDDQYGLSGYWLFDPKAKPVPDGGSSVLLLGFGLLCLALMRWYLSVQPGPELLRKV